MELRRGLMMGMAESSIKLLKVGTYTVEESWENDTEGNATAICMTVVAPYIDGKPSMYFLSFVGNNAINQNYRCDFISFLTNASANNMADSVNYAGGVARYNRSQYRTISKNTSAWVSAGTVIEIYKIDLSAY